MDSTQMQDSVDIMKQWIKKVPYLPQHLEDHVFATFVRAAKGSVERAKLILDNFYAGRLKYPELLANIDPMSTQQQAYMNNFMTVPFPKRTADGSLIILSKLINTDPSFFNAETLFKQMATILKLYLMENDLRNCQIVVIHVNDHVKLEHLVKFTPKILMATISALTSAAPVRLQAIHNVNMPSYAEFVWNLAKSLMKPKMAQRFHIHSNPQDLLDWYPKEILPAELGGLEDSLPVIYDNFRRRLETARDNIVADEVKLKKCDALRPLSDEDVAVGTFRKLSVD